MMDGKKADNIIVGNIPITENINTKKIISSLDSRIDGEKNRMKNLDEMEEMFVSLNKNITKCVELLNKSIKGKNITSKLNAIEENNRINFIKNMNSIDTERDQIKENLFKLNEERDRVNDEVRKINAEKLRKELNPEKEEEKEKENEEEKEEKVEVKIDKIEGIN